MTDTGDVTAVFEDLADANPDVRAGRFFGMAALLAGRVPLAFLDSGQVVLRRGALPTGTAGQVWVDPRGRASPGWVVTDARGDALLDLLHHLTPANPSAPAPAPAVVGATCRPAGTTPPRRASRSPGQDRT